MPLALTCTSAASTDLEKRVHASVSFFALLLPSLVSMIRSLHVYANFLFQISTPRFRAVVAGIVKQIISDLAMMEFPALHHQVLLLIYRRVE